MKLEHKRTPRTEKHVSSSQNVPKRSNSNTQSKSSPQLRKQQVKKEIIEKKVKPIAKNSWERLYYEAEELVSILVSVVFNEEDMKWNNNGIKSVRKRYKL